MSFENMYLLSLDPINLYNINLLYSETHYERVMKSPFHVCMKKEGDERCLRELREGRLEKMKEMVRGR